MRLLRVAHRRVLPLGNTFSTFRLFRYTTGKYGEFRCKPDAREDGPARMRCRKDAAKPSRRREPRGCGRRNRADDFAASFLHLILAGPYSRACGLHRNSPYLPVVYRNKRKVENAFPRGRTRRRATLSNRIARLPCYLPLATRCKVLRRAP